MALRMDVLLLSQSLTGHLGQIVYNEKDHTIRGSGS